MTQGPDILVCERVALSDDVPSYTVIFREKGHAFMKVKYLCCTVIVRDVQISSQIRQEIRERQIGYFQNRVQHSSLSTVRALLGGGGGSATWCQATTMVRFPSNRTVRDSEAAQEG